MKSRYQIVGEINQGGVGVVLKAFDTKLSRHVAIKRFLSAEQRAAMGNVEGDLLKEASTLSAMQHPNIVSVYDVDLDAEEGPEVIMEYLNGQDLEQAVSQAALTLEDFYHVAQQTLDALSNAHRMNLLHRDIKPANIQVTWLANGKFVSKFVDFGLAKFFEAPSKQTVRADGTVMGSIYYMAPEQLERLPLDNRSDLYSIGCVFYFALTMHRPFEGATVMDVINAHLHSRPVRLRDYRPNVPKELELWVEWMMSRKPQNRPADADLALNTLREIMAGKIPDAVPGARSASQPVLEGPLRTGRIPAPKSSAFVPSPAKQPATPPPPPAARPVKAKKKPAKSGRSWIMGTSVAAAIAVVAGVAIAMSGGRKSRQEPGASAGLPAPSELLKNATSATESERARQEFTINQARLAINEASAAKSALPAAPPADISQPPAEALVLWFDAAKGTIADANGTAALPNGPVGQWRDLAANAGTAVFQYTASTTKDKEKNFPTLRTAPAGAGLLKATPVLTFDGTGDTLCLRDRDKVGDAMGASLAGGNLTTLVVFRDNGADAPDGLLLFRSGANTILSLGIKGQGLVAGPGNAAPLTASGSETEFRIASCTLEATTGIHFGLITSDGQKASGDVSFKTDPTANIDVIRMGTSDGANNQRSLLAADVAEILVYNRALDQHTRHAAENYLRGKYFGSTGPTVTANSPR